MQRTKPTLTILLIFFVVVLGVSQQDREQEPYSVPGLLDDGVYTEMYVKHQVHKYLRARKDYYPKGPRKNGWVSIGQSLFSGGTDINGSKPISVGAGANFPSVGLELHFDFRYGPTYLYEGSGENDQNYLGVDIRYVSYASIINNLKIGPYLQINSTNTKRDGTVVGLFSRLELNIKPNQGLFISAVYPMAGHHEDPRDRDNARTDIAFGKFVDPQYKLRQDERKIIVGLFSRF